jgi:predicted PurR-regulated permease PerM
MHLNTMQVEQSELQQVLASIREVEGRLETKIDTFNEKFDNYQKATQWVVGLAFSLIGSATVITIIASVFRC